MTRPGVSQPLLPRHSMYLGLDSRVSKPRRPRGTRVDPVALGYAIERNSKSRLDAMAARAGVSTSVFIEQLVEHAETELDDHGLPMWWPQQEGLPIDSP